MKISGCIFAEKLVFGKSSRTQSAGLGERVSVRVSFEKTERECSLSLSLSLCFKWCHQESNRGHMDFQSIALPTELWHLLFGLQIYISNPSNQIVWLKKNYLESF